MSSERLDQTNPPAPTEAAPSADAPLAVLRRFVRRRPAAAEQCALCSADIGEVHEHLLELSTRRLVCACGACAILFGGHSGQRYRRVPRRVDLLEDLVLTDMQWEAMHIPINLAFFVNSSQAGRVVTLYPSAGGAIESLLPLDVWQELADANPVLKELESDVEALLVNRLGPAREYYRAPIDECYKLVGILRRNWRGLSGGIEVWGEIERFLSDLRQRCRRVGGQNHA